MLKSVVDQSLGDCKRVAGSLWKPCKQTAALSTRNQDSRLISIGDTQAIEAKREQKEAAAAANFIDPKSSKAAQEGFSRAAAVKAGRVGLGDGEGASAGVHAGIAAYLWGITGKREEME